VIDVGTRVTFTVATGTGLTVIADVGAEVTVSLVAVIVAVPTPVAVTVAVDPLGLTVRTSLLLEAQEITRPVTTLLFASLVVAVNCWLPPTIIGVVDAETVTVATGATVTVIDKVGALGADSLDAVIVALPVPRAVTVIAAPADVLTELAALTVSTALLLDTQFTVRPMSVVPLASFGVAVRTCVAPMIIGVVGVDTATVVTGAAMTVSGAPPV
jgi:hypothetical protein